MYVNIEQKMSGTVCKDRPFGECAVCPGDIAGAAAHFLYRKKLWPGNTLPRPEKVEELFDTNFFAPAELMKMVLPVMRKQRRGTIVNVTSIGAVRGALGNGYYSAAKGALELLTEALAKEIDHLGIRTMLVEPGAFRTNFYGEGLLGRDAAKAAETQMENRLKEIREWMEVSSQSDY